MIWEMVKINDLKSNLKYALVGGPFGSNLSGKHYVDSGVPVIRGGNLPFDKKFSANGFVYVSEEKANRLISNTAHPGDIVFTQRGTLGQVGIIPFNLHEKFIISQSQMKLTVDESKAFPLYIYYYFRTEECIQRIENAALSSGVPHINLGILQNFKIPLAPLPTQKKIAFILSAYDDLIDNNNQRIQLLEEMAEEIYKEWFVRFRFPGYQQCQFFDKAGNEVPHGTVGALPDGWEENSLAKVTGLIKRGISPTYDEKGDTIVLNQRCIRANKINLNLGKRQSKKISSEKLVRFGDILVNSTGEGTLGRVAQVYESLENWSVDSHVTIIRPSSNVNLDFLGTSLLSKQPIFENLAFGSTGQTELGREDVGKIKVIIPDVLLQNKFGKIISPMRSEIILLSKKNQLLQETRDLLLPRLISGKLDVSTMVGSDSMEELMTEGAEG